jgi:hypothetical protein
VANYVELPMKRYYSLPNPNLRSYLKRQERGNPVFIRTGFGEKGNFEDILEEWDSNLKSLGSEWPTLYDYESEMRSKVGPMSYQLPLADRLQDIEAYFTLGVNPSEEVSVEAINRMLSEWRGARGLLMRSEQSTVDRMRLSTNSGSPYFTVRNRVVERTSPYYIEKTAEGYLGKTSDYEGLLCATLGWRGQEGGPSEKDVKQRVLFMFPFAANVQELRVYQPLVESAQRLNLVPTWKGTESVDRTVTKLFDSKDREQLVVCTDFSKFDQHYGPSMQNASRRILAQLLTRNEDSERWLENVFPMKYDIPLNIAWNKFYVGPHGMGSGSGGTNADETLGHRALQHEAAASANSHLNLNSMCLGDDGILTYPGITVDHVMKSYTQHGQDMNLLKQYVKTDEVIFLRNWHHQNYRVNGVCVGVYPTMRALGHLMFQERWHDPKTWGPKAVAMRALSIINNCQYHPLGTEFVKFCVAKDKFRLGLDIPGFLQSIDKQYAEAKANDTLYVSYSQEFGNPKPPSEWWVVKVLQSLDA